MKILIVEDDSAIVELVSLCLRVSWPDSRIVFTGLAQEGIELADKENPDLIILDLGLPDRSGLELLKEVRTHSNVPVIILTVRDEESDVVRGLELGADDYITKPFRQMEFVSRAKALLRRQRASDSGSPISIGQFHFSASRRQVTCDGQSVKLTTTEGKMLYCLAQNMGKPVSHNDLSMSIWGEVPADAANSIRVHMRNLRQKLGDIGMQGAIMTKSGTGYFIKK
ncbi:response regulator transcription factor [Dehalogenimonas etheniformans]|uniref:DNA-binding response regulator n=1 Tax=Dehalogenimonas etheniformans TaxID=1536648 RepID=A0A2P5P5U3_9CHLR|nr:response regulator transcription factor [Dehalogenimonas etheniformans]PPD57671.1 DNA-binding response regulator [Dehalogenimonas etheniformans]QNT76013.1 response regulator transcription factor [Dehalogenimonas etheniformans]